jgi:hypothetical protein
MSVTAKFARGRVGGHAGRAGYCWPVGRVPGCSEHVVLVC